MMRSHSVMGDSADAWLASLSESYSLGHDGVAAAASRLARASYGGHGSNRYEGHPSYSPQYPYSSGRRAVATNRSGKSQQQSIEELIAAISKLQSKIEDQTSLYDSLAGTRTPGTVTGDILAGAAEGAKFGVLGRTAGAIGAGVGSLLGAFGVRGVNPYIDAVTGAAGIYETGARQGVTVGNVIGGAAKGASLGSAFGPLGTAIGAGVGGLLDIFGGLFGHHHSTPVTKIEDPSFYNSPSDFDYYNRLYNAMGKYPQVPGQTFGQAAGIVQVHVYTDGVQQAVQTAMGSTTTRSAMTVASAYYDHTRPQ